MNKGLIIFYISGIASVLGVSSIMYFVFTHRNFRGFTQIMSLFVLFSCYMVFAQYLKYRSLHFYVDFSHWMQIVYNISTMGRPLNLSVELTVPGAMNYLSVHFIPFIYLFAAFFKLWPFSETMIVLNFPLMASAAIPLYKLALIHRQDRRFALFMATLLLWYPSFQYIVLYEFGMSRFSIPIILWMLYFWEKKKMTAYFFFVLLAVLIREEVGLTIMMFGVYLLLIKRKFKIGLITATMGLGAFIIITQIIMPALRTTGGYEHIAMGSFSTFGNMFGKIIINVITHPILTLKTILQPAKLANIFMFFLPLLFIPLLAPAVLISTFANFGVGLLSGSITHISYMLFYMSPSIPFIFYAFIKGWPRLLDSLEALTKKWSHNLRGDINRGAITGVFSGLLVANIFFGPSPISLQFWFKDLRPAPFTTQNFHYSVYRITGHHRKAKELCDLIPDSAIVSAQHFLHPQLFKKRGVMVFPQLESSDGKYKADYVFFDKTNNGLKKGSPAHKTQSDFDIVEKDKKNWKLIMSEDGYFLYQRIR